MTKIKPIYSFGLSVRQPKTTNSKPNPKNVHRIKGVVHSVDPNIGVTIRVDAPDGNPYFYSADEYFYGDNCRKFFYKDDESPTGYVKRILTEKAHNPSKGCFKYKPGQEVEGYLDDRNTFHGLTLIK